MFETGEALSHDIFGYEDPDFLEKNAGAPPDMLEGYDYYGSKRGGKETYPNFTNVILSNIDETTVLNLGEQYADKMLQPYCGIVGSEAGTAPCTKMFYDRVTSEKEFHEIPGA